MARRSGALRFWVCVLLLSLLPASDPGTARAESMGRSFLIVTDIHFNPMAEPALVNRLVAAPPTAWAGILDSGKEQTPSRYGADTNWPLLRSTLRQMKAVLAHPAFVLVPGDFLAHHFRAKFDAASRDRSDRAYRRFVIATMRFLAGELERSFPGTPVLPAIGNNDDACGDYRLRPNGLFLADTLPIVRSLVGATAAPGFARSWTGYGNYRAGVPGAPGLSLLALNTVFFSPNYRNDCGPAQAADPGHQTLAWLAGELAAAQRAHRHLWLVYHIPPGIDGYRTGGRGSCPGPIVPMWDEGYARPFYALMRRYAGTIRASFAAHTHMDDLRLIGDGRDDFAFVVMTPAVSPIFGQNPAFRIVNFDADGSLRDETTYDLANLAQAGAGAPPRWRAEYTFSSSWRLPRIDLPSLERLYAMITTEPAGGQRWHDLFAVSSPVYWTRYRHAPGPSRADLCATGHVLPDDFRSCWCSEGQAGKIQPSLAR